MYAGGQGGRAGMRGGRVGAEVPPRAGWARRYAGGRAGTRAGRVGAEVRAQLAASLGTEWCARLRLGKRLPDGGDPEATGGSRTHPRRGERQHSTPQSSWNPAPSV